MNTVSLENHWALILAALPALVVVTHVLRNTISRTANGQLRTVLNAYRESQKNLDKAKSRSERARAHVEKLIAKAVDTKPRILTEAREAVQDAESMVKIAGDRRLVTANHVRRVICEEFPPVQHQRLREKYLPEDSDSGRPYSFR